MKDRQEPFANGFSHIDHASGRRACVRFRSGCPTSDREPSHKKRTANRQPLLQARRAERIKPLSTQSLLRTLETRRDMDGLGRAGVRREA